ncbi:hypothetical protein [Streptomyces sp. NPDC003697]
MIRNHPVGAGAGIPLFDGALDPTVLDVRERTAFAAGVTLTRRPRR